ncbi:hypothetical protein Golob_027418 [Gossypium lobatum]|uniref:Uncharacterized protein n=1 Tax=Gossypium lobatum TaxID=34289 RepID=A0A7J8NFB6_9ROSI|nr:hypothetical protein [Gossypium lobatum]
MVNFLNIEDGGGGATGSAHSFTKKVRFKKPGTRGDEDLVLLNGDVTISIVGGIPTIDFSDRIQQILFKGMELTVVLKLLGRSIGYAALQNRISSFWRPLKSFHLMDIENGYF